MTEYLVQCFDNNGEPYGRYCNPHKEYKGIKPFETLNIEWQNFEFFAETYTFPMPGAEIGKTYETGEVEVVFQYFAELNGISDDWIDCDQVWYDVMNKNSVCPTRAMFCLTQPVEKEPETVEQAEHKKITGFDSPSERKAYEEGYDDAINVCMDYIRKWKGTTNSGLGEVLYNKFNEWQKQKSN